VIQVALNRISQNYPAIPKIPTVDGVFGSRTEAAVTAFQRIFGLSPDGIVGPGTWYEIVRLYTGVNALSELRSLGQQFYAINWSPPAGLEVGDTGEKVRLLQYMLSVLSAHISSIPPVSVDGIYGQATRAAVLAAQRRFGLPETGTVGAQTWDEIYDQYSGIENTNLRSAETFPNTGNSASGSARNTNSNNGRTNYARSTTMTQFPGRNLSIGSQDPVRQEVVR
jgi:peptidoglycan hydrolase-like protein with peptidoglycan-binding domain